MCRNSNETPWMSFNMRDIYISENTKKNIERRLNILQAFDTREFLP